MDFSYLANIAERLTSLAKLCEGPGRPMGHWTLGQHGELLFASGTLGAL